MKKIKEEILDTALELFNTHSVADISIRNIATAVGISHSNLIYHYKTKQDIIRALHNQLLEQAVQLNQQHIEVLCFLETLHQSTKQGFDILYKYRFFMRELHYILREDHELKQDFIRVEKIRAAMYKERILLAIQDGYIRPESYPGEYEYFIEHIKIYSDAWITSSDIYDDADHSSIIEKYSALFISLFFPYLTPKGTENFLSLLQKQNT